jgi:hypothetical protein
MGSFRDEVEKRVQLSVSQPSGCLGPSFREKKWELIKVVRGYLIEGGVAKEGLQVSEQMAVALLSPLLRGVLLVVYEKLYWLP